MRYITLILFCFLLSSCGKSPLFNKFHAPLKEISGGVLVSEKFEFKWVVPPSLDELSSFEITLVSPLKANQTLSAYLWMPDMGHGSSPIEITQASSTNYLFTELAFIMPGLWVLHVQILEDNQVKEEWQKSVTL